MSVGVCIINKYGIALAADSAGTVGANKMFYNSMNKVFNLSYNNKIGVITYGATVIYNAPIEIILKEFRKYIDTHYQQISDFFSLIKIFEDFLYKNRSYFKFENEEKKVCINLINSLVKEWGTKINEITKGVEENLIVGKIIEIIESFKTKINEAIRIPNYDVSHYIETNYKQDIINSIKAFCPVLVGYQNPFDELMNCICDYFNLSLQSETKLPLGLLFAGYDSQTAFPKYIHLEIYNFVGGKLKYLIKDKFDEGGINSSIVLLAQPDVINTFCKGFSDNYMNAIPGIIKSEIDKRINLIEDKDKIQKCFEGIQNDIVSTLINKSREEYINPLLWSLNVLQIPDLALLAENLVNITSLKRKFSMDGYQQTVGGPTDVATISSNEGFIWIKRKHYFDKELNPHFVERYK